MVTRVLKLSVLAVLVFSLMLVAIPSMAAIECLCSAKCKLKTCPPKGSTSCAKDCKCIPPLKTGGPKTACGKCQPYHPDCKEESDCKGATADCGCWPSACGCPKKCGKTSTPPVPLPNPCAGLTCLSNCGCTTLSTCKCACDLCQCGDGPLTCDICGLTSVLEGTKCYNETRRTKCQIPDAKNCRCLASNATCGLCPSYSPCMDSPCKTTGCTSASAGCPCAVKCCNCIQPGYCSPSTNCHCRVCPPFVVHPACGAESGLDCEEHHCH
jgi:hypothetical protein